MTIRFCDDRASAGFSWIVDEPATRTSHALSSGGLVWLVDPVDWPEAIDRAVALGEPVAVLQLLDRHNRDCAAVASRLGVSHHTTPAGLPGSPFDVVPVRRSRMWREIALWWAEQQTLVVAEAVGTNGFYTGGREAVGVHVLLRLTPPTRQLGAFEPEHLLVGHGEGVHGADSTPALRDALARSRTGLLRVAPKIPGLIVDARRRRR
jgi:hypothetical protein